MKIIKAHITNYRCVDDSEEFTLNQTTCLVGKNESGKTTLLRAIEKLNPLGETKISYDKTRGEVARKGTRCRCRLACGQQR